MNSTEALFHSIRSKEADRVTTLVTAEPVLLDARDNRGSTPLVLATYLGDLAMTKALVGAGAKIDAQDAAGNTALMGVCFKGYEDIAGYLLEQGADPGVINFSGASALTFAATFNRPGMAELLLNAGADPARRDERGLTPADHARNQGLQQLAERLEAHP